MQDIEMFLRTMAELVRTHQESAVAIVFFITFAECLAVFSWAISTPMLFATIGILAGASGSNILPLGFAASLGAGCGFWSSYGVGLLLGPHIGERWPFRGHPQWLSRAHQFFEKWGALSVFLAHFFPPVRGAIAIVAGTVRMSPLSFHLGNWPASFIWGFGILYSASRLAVLAVQTPP